MPRRAGKPWLVVALGEPRQERDADLLGGGAHGAVERGE
jgi:hypothetical protein